MSVSKPIYNFLGWYLENLFNKPIKTKALTSCVVFSSANLVSQKIGSHKSIDTQNLFAYGLFGLLFGGTLPHYFYTFLERILDQDLKYRSLIQFLLERIIFAPSYQAVSLYFLSIFEGKPHKEAVRNLLKLYIPMIQANWKYISIFTLINFTMVPPMLRVFFANIVGFCWIVFLANKRRQMIKKADS